jgi:hypothetical protein
MTKNGGQKSRDTIPLSMREYSLVTDSASCLAIMRTN